MFRSPFLYSFTLFLSLLLLLFAPQFLPPKDLDDLVLFHKASLKFSRPTPKIVRLGSTNPEPKIAFLFLTNSNLSFSPLWEIFFKQYPLLYNIYIHADLTVDLAPPAGVFAGRFIKAKKTERSSPTLISATRRLLAHALLDDHLNLYFALVSQHCIPLHSFRFIYNSLFGISSISLRAFSNQLKYPSFIEILPDEPNLYERYIARGESVMLPEVPFEEFRVGSQFFILARRHALLVIRDKKLWRKFRLPCLNLESCYPEEHYFPTLLSMADPKGCTHFALTRVNWTDSTDGHPHMYRPPEVSPELVYKLRESNSSYSYFFARKFSPDCLDPLMEIAESVIFRD